MKRIASIGAALVVMASVPARIQAEYVLPYPSAMPGNRLYALSRLVDRLKQPFYFGSIASYKYHLILADKYLVEAKTLFEYKQYLLARDALHRSDAEFAEVPKFLASAKAEGKDTRNFARQLADAAAAHGAVLAALNDNLPALFRWTPEKGSTSDILIAGILEQSIRLREGVAAQLPHL